MKAEMSVGVKEEIMLGLQKLLALQLERAPALETLAKTGLVWMETIGHNRCLTDEDAPRFREAFVLLAARCKSWPSPVALLEVLPERPPLPALPEPEISPEQRAENLAFLDDLLAGIRMPGSKPREEAEQHRGRFRVVGGEA